MDTPGSVLIDAGVFKNFLTRSCCKARSAGRWEIREYLAYYYRDVYGDGGVGLEIAIK